MDRYPSIRCLIGPEKFGASGGLHSLFVEWTCQVGCRLCGLASGFRAQRVWFYGGRLRTKSHSWVGWRSGLHYYRYANGPLVWHPAGYLAAEQLKTLVFGRAKFGQSTEIDSVCFQT